MDLVFTTIPIALNIPNIIHMSPNKNAFAEPDMCLNIETQSPTCTGKTKPFNITIKPTGIIKLGKSKYPIQVRANMVVVTTKVPQSATLSFAFLLKKNNALFTRFPPNQHLTWIVLDATTKNAAAWPRYCTK